MTQSYTYWKADKVDRFQWHMCIYLYMGRDLPSAVPH